MNCKCKIENEKPCDGASKTSIKLENVGTTSSMEAKPKVEIPPCDICTDVVPQEVFKQYKCALCSKRYADKQTFENHVKSHKGVKYTCAKCPDKIFTNKQAFQ